MTNLCRTIYISNVYFKMKCLILAPSWLSLFFLSSLSSENEFNNIISSEKVKTAINDKELNPT